MRRGVPCVTTVQGLGAAVQGIEAIQRGEVGVRSLQEHALLAGGNPPAPRERRLRGHPSGRPPSPARRRHRAGSTLRERRAA